MPSIYLLLFSLLSAKSHRTKLIMGPSKTTISRKIKKFLITIAWGITTRRSRGQSRGQYPQPMTCRPEIYLPSHIWDSQNPVERYASVGDLCAHLGEQLPIQLVKRIARDVLRGLVVLHKTRGMAHGGEYTRSIRPFILIPMSSSCIVSSTKTSTRIVSLSLHGT